MAGLGVGADADRAVGGLRQTLAGGRLVKLRRTSPEDDRSWCLLVRCSMWRTANDTRYGVPAGASGGLRNQTRLIGSSVRP